MSLVNNKLKKDDLIYFFVVNSVTNIFAQLISLLVFYFIPTLNYFILFIPLEGVVVLAEIFLYQIKYRNIKLSLLSILGNLFTIGISLIFYFLCDRIGESSFPLSDPRDTTAAYGTAVRCPLPGKCPLMQAWRPPAGFIAQNAVSHTDWRYYYVLTQILLCFTI